MANFAPSPPDTRAAAAAPAARPRDKIGDLLRRTREEQGGDIDVIATTLRIRAAYLVAIEDARYDRLPGPVYALGFVRTYANHLGLDGDEAVRRFKLEAAGLEQRRDLAFPVPLTPRSIPGGRMLLAAFVLAVCAYGIWHYLSTGDRTRPERVASVPADLMPPPPPPAAAPAPPAAPAMPSADTAAAPAAAAPADTPAPAPSPPDQTAAAAAPSAAPSPAPVTVAPLPSPAASGNLVAPPAPPLPGAAPTPGPDLTANTPTSPAQPAPNPAPAVTVAAAPTAPPPGTTPADAAAQPTGPRVFGAIDGPSRITLKAVKDCWIQVRDSDPAQTVVAQRTLHAGDSYRVPSRDGLVLRTGNATGLQVMVDDKPAPALGGTVRNVALDPARLLAGDARVE
jgi:cytoskeleton protein RodZ